MSLEQEYLRNLWRWKCGMSEPRAPENSPDIRFLERIQLNPRFESLMPEHFFSVELQKLRLNRVVMGFFRYGDNRRTSLAATNYCGEAVRRIKKYSDTLKLEYVVDALNILMLEFIGAELRGETSGYVLEEIRKKKLRALLVEWAGPRYRNCTAYSISQLAISQILKFEYEGDVDALIIASWSLSMEYCFARCKGETVEGVDDGHTIRYD